MESKVRDLINAAIGSSSGRAPPDDGGTITLGFPEGKVVARTPELERALESMNAYEETSTRYYNRLLGALGMEPLGNVAVLLAEESYKNTFWNGQNIIAPPAVRRLPEIIYHENAYRFLDAIRELTYRGQPGALKTALAGILAELVDQREKGLSAAEADWLLAPGAVSWLTGRDAESAQPKLPLRSLRAPGTAYDHPVLGSDPQVAHMEDIYNGVADNGGVHTNAGIPAKAFYEAAVLVGSEETILIWLTALADSLPGTDFAAFAQATVAAARNLHEPNSDVVKAIEQGWTVVGLPQAS